jgi:hypothetical protein
MVFNTCEYMRYMGILIFENRFVVLDAEPGLAVILRSAAAVVEQTVWLDVQFNRRTDVQYNRRTAGCLRERSGALCGTPYLQLGFRLLGHTSVPL